MADLKPERVFAWSYGYGWAGVKEHQLVRAAVKDDGSLDVRTIEVVISGISEEKAKVIAMILNASEDLPG